MPRKLKAELEADVAGFVRPVEEAKKSVNDLGDKLDHLDHKLDETAVDAAKAGVALKLLSGNVDDVGKKVGQLGDKSTGLAVLDAKIRESRTEVRKLADEFQKTGDIDVFRRLGDAQGRLGALTKIRQEVAKSVEFGVKGGLDAIGNAGEWEGLASVAWRWGAIIAAPLATGLIAALGGAITAGAGATVAGLGVLGAVLGDPERFKLAWGSTLNSLTKQFIDATKPFAGPTLDAIASIGPTIAGWHIDTIFANAAKFVPTLVRGTEGLATGLINGVGALVDKGGPAIDALSQGMTQLGQAGESALTSIANGAEGGALALHDTITAVSLLIEGTGKLVQGFENAYEYVHNHPLESALETGGLSAPITIVDSISKNVHQLGELQKAADATSASMQGAGHSIDLAGGQAMSASDQFGLLTSQLKAVNNTADTAAAAAVHKLFTATVRLDEATLGVNKSLLQLHDTLEQNGKQIDKNTGLTANNTEKGIANRQAILGAVTANMQLYQAQVAAGMKAEDAAKAYDENTKSLEKQLKAAGYTTAQIDDLIGKYRGIPGKVDSVLAIDNLTEAIRDLDELLRKINHLDGRTITINEVTYTRTEPSQWFHGNATGAIRRAAVGMIVPPRDPGTLIGEPQTGGEALIPLRGIAPTRAAWLGQIAMSGYGYNVVPGVGGGGGGGMQTLRVVMQYPDGRVIQDKVIEFNANRGRYDPATFFLP